MMTKKHRTAIQLRFKDVDALGHVNNANHLTYFETARIAYFNETVGEAIDWRKEGMILARVTVDYKLPVLLKDRVFVNTWVISTGRTSFELGYELVKEENGQDVICAVGTSVIVCFNYETQKPVEIPASWKEKLLAQI